MDSLVTLRLIPPPDCVLEIQSAFSDDSCFSQYALDDFSGLSDAFAEWAIANGYLDENCTILKRFTPLVLSNGQQLISQLNEPLKLSEPKLASSREFTCSEYLKSIVGEVDPQLYGNYLFSSIPPKDLQKLLHGHFPATCFHRFAPLCEFSYYNPSDRDVKVPHSLPLPGKREYIQRLSTIAQIGISAASSYGFNVLTESQKTHYTVAQLRVNGIPFEITSVSDAAIKRLFGHNVYAPIAKNALSSNRSPLFLDEEQATSLFLSVMLRDVSLCISGEIPNDPKLFFRLLREFSTGKRCLRQADLPKRIWEATRESLLEKFNEKANNFLEKQVTTSELCKQLFRSHLLLTLSQIGGEDTRIEELYRLWGQSGTELSVPPFFEYRSQLLLSALFRWLFGDSSVECLKHVHGLALIVRFGVGRTAPHLLVPLVIEWLSEGSPHDPRQLIAILDEQQIDFKILHGKGKWLQERGVDWHSLHVNADAMRGSGHPEVRYFGTVFKAILTRMEGKNPSLTDLVDLENCSEGVCRLFGMPTLTMEISGWYERLFSLRNPWVSHEIANVWKRRQNASNSDEWCREGCRLASFALDYRADEVFIRLADDLWSSFDEVSSSAEVLWKRAIALAMHSPRFSERLKCAVHTHTSAPKMFLDWMIDEAMRKSSPEIDFTRMLFNRHFSPSNTQLLFLSDRWIEQPYGGDFCVDRLCSLLLQSSIENLDPYHKLFIRWIESVCNRPDEAKTRLTRLSSRLSNQKMIEDLAENAIDWNLKSPPQELSLLHSLFSWLDERGATRDQLISKAKIQLARNENREFRSGGNLASKILHEALTRDCNAEIAQSFEMLITPLLSSDLSYWESEIVRWIDSKAEQLEEWLVNGHRDFLRNYFELLDRRNKPPKFQYTYKRISDLAIPPSRLFKWVEEVGNESLCCHLIGGGSVLSQADEELWWLKRAHRMSEIDKGNVLFSRLTSRALTGPNWSLWKEAIAKGHLSCRQIRSLAARAARLDDSSSLTVLTDLVCLATESLYALGRTDGCFQKKLASLDLIKTLPKGKRWSYAKLLAEGQCREIARWESILKCFNESRSGMNGRVGDLWRYLETLDTLKFPEWKRCHLLVAELIGKYGNGDECATLLDRVSADGLPEAETSCEMLTALFNASTAPIPDEDRKIQSWLQRHRVQLLAKEGTGGIYGYLWLMELVLTRIKLPVREFIAVTEGIKMMSDADLEIFTDKKKQFFKNYLKSINTDDELALAIELLESDRRNPLLKWAIKFFCRLPNERLTRSQNNRFEPIWRRLMTRVSDLGFPLAQEYERLLFRYPFLEEMNGVSEILWNSIYFFDQLLSLRFISRKARIMFCVVILNLLAEHIMLSEVHGKGLYEVMSDNQRYPHLKWYRIWAYIMMGMMTAAMAVLGDEKN